MPWFIVPDVLLDIKRAKLKSKKNGNNLQDDIKLLRDIENVQINVNIIEENKNDKEIEIDLDDITMKK